jgi:hypothetical protein
MSQDLYANTAARLDTIIGDAAKTWVMVNAAKRDYDTVADPKESFYVWLQQVHGVKLQFTPDGDLTLANEIVNTHKYILFLLKYSNES